EIEPIVWINYTHEVLTRLFPSHPRLSEKVVLIVENEKFSADSNNTRIEISTGLIREVKNENEYAIVLAHELGHNLWRHIEENELVRKQRPPRARPGLPTGAQLRRIRLNETESDLVSILTV